MASFLARRLGAMLLTMLCLTLVVFYLVNLEPNLRKLAISQTEMHATDQELESWLVKNGYRRPFFVRYAAWLGVWPKQPAIDPATGVATPRFSWCDEPTTPRFSGVLQGDLGCSTKFKVKVADKLGPALEATGASHVLGPGGHGPGRARDRRHLRHARGLADRPDPVGDLDRDHLDARIRVGRGAHHHLRHLARLAQRLGRLGDRRPRQLSTTSPCRSPRLRSTAWAMSRA